MLPSAEMLVLNSTELDDVSNELAHIVDQIWSVGQ